MPFPTYLFLPSLLSKAGTLCLGSTFFYCCLKIVPKEKAEVNKRVLLYVFFLSTVKASKWLLSNSCKLFVLYILCSLYTLMLAILKSKLNHAKCMFYAPLHPLIYVCQVQFVYSSQIMNMPQLFPQLLLSDNFYLIL